MAMLSIPAPRISPDAASLTQRGARTGAGCPACGSARLTQIAMTLTDGTPVQFTSCHTCEHRSWTHDGSSLPIDLVITKATKVR